MHVITPYQTVKVEIREEIKEAAWILHEAALWAARILHIKRLKWRSSLGAWGGMNCPRNQGRDFQRSEEEHAVGMFPYMWEWTLLLKTYPHAVDARWAHEDAGDVSGDENIMEKARSCSGWICRWGEVNLGKIWIWERKLRNHPSLPSFFVFFYLGTCILTGGQYSRLLGYVGCWKKAQTAKLGAQLPSWPAQNDLLFTSNRFLVEMGSGKLLDQNWTERKVSRLKHVQQQIIDGFQEKRNLCDTFAVTTVYSNGLALPARCLN